MPTENNSARRSAAGVSIPIVGPGNPAGTLDVASLVREHHAALYGYAYRLSGNGVDAEDLTQQTYLSAQRNLHQVREPTKIRGWLFSILRNQYLKTRRRKTPVSAAAMDLDIDTLPEEPPPEDPFDRQQLQHALDELPDVFRMVVMMFYFEELSYKEIAANLQVPLGTVMSRLSRAKGYLRHRLLSEHSSSVGEHPTAGLQDPQRPTRQISPPRTMPLPTR